MIIYVYPNYRMKITVFILYFVREGGRKEGREEGRTNDGTMAPSTMHGQGVQTRDEKWEKSQRMSSRKAARRGLPDKMKVFIRRSGASFRNEEFAPVLLEAGDTVSQVAVRASELYDWGTLASHTHN